MRRELGSDGRPLPQKGKRVEDAAWKRLRKIVIARDTYCYICGKEVDKTLKYPHPLSASVDHRIPVTHGGRNELSNLYLAHFVCNSSRGAKDINEVRVSRPSRNLFGDD